MPYVAAENVPGVKAVYAPARQMAYRTISDPAVEAPHISMPTGLPSFTPNAIDFGRPRLFGALRQYPLLNRRVVGRRRCRLMASGQQIGAANPTDNGHDRRSPLRRREYRVDIMEC